MKTKLKFILLALYCFYGCSSDNGEEKIKDEPDINNIQLITKIKSLNIQNWEKYGDLFIYENNRLKFTLFEGCSRQIQYYEYNDKGQISGVYHGGYINRNDFDPITFNVQEFKSDGSTSLEEYIYENGRLIERHEPRRIFYSSYDNQGRLKSVDQYELDTKEYYEKWTFNYKNDEIESIQRDNLETGNTTIYTYEFDDKSNPLYMLKTEFGLADIETCRALDYSGVDGMIFKNNVTKIYENGELTYSATMEYKDDYPNRNSWVDYEYSYSNIEIYSY